ncbi:MAG: adenosylmethionine--8-amino-7-oxononanoate transaminase [Pirellulales bacterium]|nr:adenosylmethionine--8-amino-7-oxononanoate transaminase [Pirellulales bacterium]
MSSNADLTLWDRHHHWHAFTQMAEYEPLVIERAEGVWLIDVEGNRYLDGVSSLWCNLFGHGHPRIKAALREQLDQVAHSTSLGMGNRPAAQLAKRLADIAPGDLQHVFYASDGSSAVECALKMAFQYWRQCEQPRPEKTTYVALGQAYHGDTLGSASVGGIQRFHTLFEPLLFDVIRTPAPDPRSLPPDVDPSQATQYFLAQLEELLATQHLRIAAVILEPLIQGAAGMIFHPHGYLRGVRSLTERYNVLLITDEIVTGLGRTGRMFACEHEGVVPDILCLGKSLTGGYLPMAAAISTPEIYNAFLGCAASERAFHHGHTYGGNPLAAAAALATIDLLEEEQQSKQLAVEPHRLESLLKKINAHPHVGATRHLGMIGAIELTASPSTPQPYPAELRIAARVCREALRHGVWLRPLGDVLVVMPPLSITSEELDFLCQVLHDSIDLVTDEVQHDTAAKEISL